MISFASLETIFLFKMVHFAVVSFESFCIVKIVLDGLYHLSYSTKHQINPLFAACHLKK